MKCLNRIFLIIGLGILLLSNFSLFAQTQDTTRIYQGKTIQVVADRYIRMTKFNEIAAKIPLALHETPVSVGVVTQQVLKDQNATVLSDALENISSINIHSNLGTQDYFLIRGFESTSAGLVLTDGATEPDESLFKFYGFGFYDLYNVDQVEVLKGPAAFLYGGNTLSGAVNLVRKQPLFKNFAEMSLSHGKFQSYRETIDTGFAHPDSIYAVRVNGVWQTTGSFRKHVSNRSYAINPALTWNLKKHGSLTANFEYVHSDIKPDIGIPLYVPEETWQMPDVPRETSYQTPFDRVDYDMFRFRLDYRRNIGQSSQFRNKLFITYLNGKSRFTLAHIPYRTLAEVWVVDRHIYSFDETQPFVGNQLEFILSFQTSRMKHQLLLGLEAARLGNQSTKRTTPLNTLLLYHPFDLLSDFDELITFQTRIKTNARNLVLAPYLVDFISFSDKLQLFCGGRADFIDFHTDRQNAPFEYIGRLLSSKPIPFSQSYVKFSPLIGLVVKDSEKLWFYVNIGKSFAQGVRVVDEPEESTQFEIGYKYTTLNDKIRTSGAIYNLKKENVSIPLTGPLQGDLYSSSGSQRSLGLELELTAMPMEDLYMFLTYSYIEAELIKYTALTATPYGKLELADFSGNIPAFVPAQISNLWITKEFDNNLIGGAGIRYVGKQYINMDNDFSIDGYFIYSAMVCYRIGKWNLRLNIENLTNTEYLTRGLGPYSIIPAGSVGIFGSIDLLL